MMCKTEIISKYVYLLCKIHISQTYKKKKKREEWFIVIQIFVTTFVVLGTGLDDSVTS
jgi:hypothetical protein